MVTQIKIKHINMLFSKFNYGYCITIFDLLLLRMNFLYIILNASYISENSNGQDYEFTIQAYVSLM